MYTLSHALPLFCYDIHVCVCMCTHIRETSKKKQSTLMSFFRIPIHTTEHTKRCNLKTLTALITADTVAKGNTFKVTHVKKKFTGKNTRTSPTNQVQKWQQGFHSSDSHFPHPPATHRMISNLPTLKFSNLLISHLSQQVTSEDSAWHITGSCYTLAAETVIASVVTHNSGCDAAFQIYNRSPRSEMSK